MPSFVIKNEGVELCQNGSRCPASENHLERKGGRQMVKTEYISRFECHFYSFSLQSKVLGFVVKTKI